MSTIENLMSSNSKRKSRLKLKQTESKQSCTQTSRLGFNSRPCQLPALSWATSAQLAEKIWKIKEIIYIHLPQCDSLYLTATCMARRKHEKKIVPSKRQCPLINFLQILISTRHQHWFWNHAETKAASQRSGPSIKSSKRKFQTKYTFCACNKHFWAKFHGPLQWRLGNPARTTGAESIHLEGT